MADQQNSSASNGPKLSLTGKLFASMSPKAQRNTKVALIAAGACLVIWIGNSAFEQDEEPKKKRNDVVRNILTNSDTRQLGIDGLAASVQRMRHEVGDLSAAVKKIADKADRDEKRRALEMSRELTEIKKQIQEIRTASESKPRISEPTDRKSAHESRRKVRESVENFDGKNRSDSSHSVASENTRPLPETTEKIAPIDPVRIVTIRSTSSEKDTDKRNTRKKNANTAKGAVNPIEFYMPTGSIISAVLLNGLDASTATGAKNEPMPALLRVEKDAILPNRFTSDIRECFILASGHGDLSSERAFLRGEYLSCVRNDGGVLETKFPSYVVGEDGKAGMRGHLVSKQGQVIARTLVAGFASGVSKAFDVTPVSVLDTTSVSGSMSYQTNYSPDLVQGAAAQGASRALEKVADFYLKMAEQMFPVVEITAGRRIDVIVTAGTKLRLENLNELSDTAHSAPTAVESRR